MSVTTGETDLVEKDGILTLTFTRPRFLNAINPAITAALWHAVDELGSRPGLRALVITGTGRFFSAGIDVKVGDTGRYPGPEASGFDWRRAYRAHHRLYDEIETVEKPVILAANGPCLGAGLELALSCDFRFCTPETYFSLPETGLGVIPGSGGVSRLTRLVGTHWAKWIAMAGRPVTAEQALQIGLVHEVYTADEFGPAVSEFARSLSSLSAEALALAKLVIDMCDPMDREKARHAERLANTDLKHRRAGGPTADSTSSKIQERPNA
jgi:enoyl-CoA hydratase/carnithine racemase